MASGSQRYLARQKESVAGTLPVPFDATKLRVVPGSAIENARTNVTSNEIRDDRQIIVSRLGQNAPQLTVPGELSFDSYDDLIAGALGSDWLGDFNLTGLIVDFSSADTITTDDASNWADKGVTVGSVFIIDGSTVDDGVYIVEGILGSTMTLNNIDGSAPVFSGTVDDTINVYGGYSAYELDTSTNTITVVASAKTVTSTTAYWESIASIKVGDRIYFEGFTNAGNNGLQKVVSVTDTVLTLASDTLVDETLSVGTLTTANASARVTCGTDLASFSVEEGFTDIDEYHNVTGAKVGTWSMSIQTDSIITTEFGMSAVTYSGFSNASIANSLTDANVNEVFDSYTGTLTIPGVAQCVITGFDFSLDNNLNVRYALLQRNACSIGEGRTNITGSISAYFPDSVLSKIYNDEVALNFSLYFEDTDGNGYTFGFPNVKFTSDAIDVAENDVTESISFQALGGDALTSMYVIKQPAVA